MRQINGGKGPHKGRLNANFGKFPATIQSLLIEASHELTPEGNKVFLERKK